MASRSSQRKSDSRKNRKLLEKILADGACLRPGPDVAETARELARLGIVDAQERVYVRCANPRDKDLGYTRNRNCTGRIYLDQAIDRAGEEYQCPSCDRRVYPERKQQFEELRCCIRPAGVKSWLEESISNAKYTFKEMEPWFYRVDMGEAEVHLCVVDYSEAHAKMTREWGSRARQSGGLGDREPPR